jgi:putative transposase
MVLLPEHLHTIWTLPFEDKDYPRRWGWIKKEFTKAWLNLGKPEAQVTASKRGDRRHGVWQRRFWEHVLRDDNDYERHCDYIHHNPVKHRLVRCPRDWPYSSFHRFVKAGDYDADWGCSDRAVPQFEDLDTTAME